jgi:hypothetical protein
VVSKKALATVVTMYRWPRAIKWVVCFLHSDHSILSMG